MLALGFSRGTASRRRAPDGGTAAPPAGASLFQGNNLSSRCRLRSRIDPRRPLLPPALCQRGFDIRTSERSTVLTFCSRSQLSRVFGRRGGEQSGRWLVMMAVGELRSGLGSEHPGLPPGTCWFGKDSSPGGGGYHGSAIPHPDAILLPGGSRWEGWVGPGRIAAPDYAPAGK